MNVARKKTHLTRIVLAAAVALTLAVMAWFFLHQAPVPVDVARVDRGMVEVTVGDDGVARVREVYALAAPVAGRLLRVDAEVGDPVVARQTILARLAPAEPAFLDVRSRAVAEARLREAEAQAAAASADVRRAEAALALARRDFARVATLAESGTVARAALDRSRATRDEALAAVSAARAAATAARGGVGAARSQLLTPTGAQAGGVVVLRAPVSGTVLQVLRESETVVPAGAPILEIGNPDGDLEIVVDLLSSDAVQVRPGAVVSIEGWGGKEYLKGRVRRVEPYGFLKISALGVEEQRVNVRIDLTGPKAAWSRLGHGYRIEARIVTDRVPEVVRVPTSALFRHGDQWAAFVDDDGRARMQPLTIGLMNDRYAEVKSGLLPGQQVVLFPSETVAEGLRLTRRR